MRLSHHIGGHGRIRTPDIAGIVGSAYRAAVLADSPISYWRQGEASGTTMNDVQGVNNGTYGAAVTLAQAGLLTTDTDTAALYTGGVTTSHAVAKSGFLLAGLVNCSIEFLVKRNGAAAGTGAAVYCERAAAGNDIFKVQIGQNAVSGSNINLVYRDDAGTLNASLNSTATVVDNLAHHVVVTKSGTAIAFYVDAAASGTGTLTATNNFTNASPQVWIGGDIADNPASSQAMVIDEVAVYNTALSAARVAAHYAAR